MDNENKTEIQRSDNLPQREDHVVGNSRSDHTFEQRNDTPVAENTPQKSDNTIGSAYNGETSFSKPEFPESSVTLGPDQSAYTTKKKKKKKKKRIDLKLIGIISGGLLVLTLLTGWILFLIEAFNGISFYNLTFDEKGGTSAGMVGTGSPFYKIDSTHTSSRPGYEFLGWSKTPDAVSPDYEIGDIIHLTEEETCLYAVWQIVSFSLSYDANGGTGAPPIQPSDSYWIINDEPRHLISSEEPSLSGFKFLGWSMDPNAHNASYRANDYIFISSDTTLYAVWVMNGDIDKSGTLNGYDLNELEYYLYGDLLFDDEEYKIADFNSDGSVDELDLKEMKSYSNLPEQTEDEVISEDLYQIMNNILS